MTYVRPMNKPADINLSHIQPASEASYAAALEILREGGLVALPTETVYGLAANAENDAAVARVYALKGRPAHNPLIAHILRPEEAGELAHVNALAQTLIDAFWPGPLTLVLPRKETDLSETAGGWLPTIAVRCPDTVWLSPTTAAHVVGDFGDKVDLIIDGGRCRGGVESTVLQIHDDHAVLLRPGTIAAEDFAPFISDLRLSDATPIISAPGMLASHYAPHAQVRLNAVGAGKGEVLLGFGKVSGDLNLSETGDCTEAAHNLYDYLRRLDREGVNTIAIAPIPKQGLGLAINDRLRRAAADR